MPNQLDGPFKGTEIAAQIAAWATWPDDNRPEAHPAVAHYKQHPPEGSDFEILGNVKVRQSWEDKSDIQCNICNVKHKFGVNEGWVAAYDDGWWYIVGPTCGSVTHRGRVSIALNAHLQRQADALADETIRKFLDFRPEWQAYYEVVKSGMQSVYAVFKNVREQTQAFTALANAARDGGRLTVDRTQNKWGGHGNGPKPPKVMGKLRGGDFLIDPPMPRLRKLKEALSPLLQQIPRDELNAYLVKNDSAGTLPDVSLLLRGQLREMDSLRDLVISTAQFVSASNLALIQRWSLDDGAPFRGPFQYVLLESTLVLPQGPERKQHSIDLVPILQFNPQRPY